MRCLERNKVPFYYSLYLGEEPILDEYGNESGEYKVAYSEPMQMRANISPASGNTQSESFGTSIQYDKIIVTDDLNCPIDEHSILLVDSITSDMLCDELGRPLLTQSDIPLQVENDMDSPHFDYIVKKVARSLNSISYAISRVEVSS